jgi:3-methyladenine DNA glycosylase AlkC
MTKSKKPITKAETAKKKIASAKPASSKTREGSKHDLILGLVRRRQGATIAELQDVSGWQPHSVRGFLSGAVKKRLGLKLQSIKGKDGERRYSIAAG